VHDVADNCLLLIEQQAVELQRRAPDGLTDFQGLQVAAMPLLDALIYFKVILA
jgi:hypothetical protein